MDFSISRTSSSSSSWNLISLVSLMIFKQNRSSNKIMGGSSLETHHSLTFSLQVLHPYPYLNLDQIDQYMYVCMYVCKLQFHHGRKREELFKSWNYWRQGIITSSVCTQVKSTRRKSFLPFHEYCSLLARHNQISFSISCCFLTFQCKWTNFSRHYILFF